MDFTSCVQVLAARPADAHAHCDHACHEEEEELEHAQSQSQSAGESESESESADAATAASAEDAAADIDALTARALVRAFFRLQEQRVRIYADFHKGFAAHKKTPAFQPFSERITKRFAGISEQINRVEQSLKLERQQPAIAQLVRKVQLEEKDNLLLTSAVLIEKMRREDAASAQEPDESAVAFLERSVATLSRKHADCVGRINELLDELRIEAAELQDEDEDA